MAADDPSGSERWAATQRAQWARRRPEEVGGDVKAVTFNRAGSLYAVGTTESFGGPDNMLRVFRARVGKMVYRIRAHRGGTFAAAFSSDGALLASGGGHTMLRGGEILFDATLRVWDVATARLVAEVAEVEGVSGTSKESVWNHRWQWKSVCFSPDGRRLAAVESRGEDDRVKVWEVGSWRLVRAHEPALWVGPVRYDADGSLVVMSGLRWEGLVGRYLGEGWHDKRVVPGYLISAAVGEGERFVATAHGERDEYEPWRNGEVCVWEVGTRRLIRRYAVETPPAVLAISGDGMEVVGGGDYGRFGRWVGG